MIGVRSNQLLAIIDSVFDVRNINVGTAIHNGGYKCEYVLIGCCFWDSLDRQFGERSGKVTEGRRPARFGSTGFRFRCDTFAIEAHSLQGRVLFDEVITSGTSKNLRQPIKQGTRLLTDGWKPARFG